MPNSIPVTDAPAPLPVPEDRVVQPCASEHPVEVGGRDGPDPTRYGDWEKNGRCIDF